MSERLDRYNLAARLEKFGDQLMTVCEKGEAIENRIDVCSQISAVCRITMTLKALRTEDRLAADPDAAIAGSAVRKYAAQFSAEGSRRAAGGGADVATEPFVADDADPFPDPAEE